MDALDAEVAASGVTKQMEKDLQAEFGGQERVSDDDEDDDDVSGEDDEDGEDLIEEVLDTGDISLEELPGTGVSGGHHLGEVDQDRAAVLT